HRDAALEARNYFDLSSRPIPPFVRNQFGASVGGPLARDRTFFFASYEGFREVRASTAIATVPDALAHQGFLPAANDPSACTSASPSGCVSVATDPRVQPFLALLPPSNGADNGDGTGDLITADRVPRTSTTAWSVWTTTSPALIRCSGVTLRMTALPLCRTSERRPELMYQGSRWAMRPGISTSLCRTVRV